MSRIFGCAVITAALMLSSLTAGAAGIAPSATEISPILLGSTLPDPALRDRDDQPTTLHKVVDGKPAVLVFYRGGWCPFCNVQLSELREIHPELTTLGYQLIAISPDLPAELNKTLGKDQLDYTLVSDSSTAAVSAFGIGYTVEDSLVARYRIGGIDLEKASGETHHVLPVPSVYIVDGDGVLQFSYVHPDYKVRAPGQVILAAAREIAKQTHKLHPKR